MGTVLAPSRVASAVMGYVSSARVAPVLPLFPDQFFLVAGWRPAPGVAFGLLGVQSHVVGNDLLDGFSGKYGLATCPDNGWDAGGRFRPCTNIVGCFEFFLIF